MIYRSVLIGCGNIGSLYADDALIKGIYTHAGAYVACESTDLVAVCDVDREKALSCAKKWDVSQVYSDIDLLIKEQCPDIVSICTPDRTHADVLEIVLNAPSVRAVLVEKPLALDVKKAEKLIQFAKDKNIILAVNYSRRYSESHYRIKKLIQASEIGVVQSVSGFYTKGLFHNGTHWLDLARWLIGEIHSVQGFNVDSVLQTDPNLNVWIKFENGSTGFLQNLDAKAFSLFEMDIIGTLGRVRLTDSGHCIEYFNVVDSPYYSGYKTLLKTKEDKGDLDNSVFNAVCDLVNCLNHQVEPRCSGLDGLFVLKIASFIVKSAQNSMNFHLKTGVNCHQ